jgi:hypothetical protein
VPARHALQKSQIRTRFEHWISSQKFPTLTISILARRNGLVYADIQSSASIPTRSGMGRMELVSESLALNPAHAEGSELGEAGRLKRKRGLLRIRPDAEKQFAVGMGKYLFVTHASQETVPVTDRTCTSSLSEEGGSTSPPS